MTSTPAWAGRRTSPLPRRTSRSAIGLRRSPSSSSSVVQRRSCRSIAGWPTSRCPSRRGRTSTRLGCRVGRRHPLRARRRRPDHGRAAGAVRVAARRHGATRRPRHVGADVVVLDRLPDAHAAAGAADVPRPGHGDVVRLRPDVPPAGLVPVHRSPTPVADLVRRSPWSSNRPGDPATRRGSGCSPTRTRLSPVATLGIVAAIGAWLLAGDLWVRIAIGVCAGIDVVVALKADSVTGWLALVRRRGSIRGAAARARADHPRDAGEAGPGHRGDHRRDRRGVDSVDDRSGRRRGRRRLDCRPAGYLGLRRRLGRGSLAGRIRLVLVLGRSRQSRRAVRAHRSAVRQCRELVHGNAALSRWRRRRSPPCSRRLRLRTNVVGGARRDELGDGLVGSRRHVRLHRERRREPHRLPLDLLAAARRSRLCRDSVRRGVAELVGEAATPRAPALRRPTPTSSAAGLIPAGRPTRIYTPRR